MAGGVYTDADIAAMRAQASPAPATGGAPKTYTDADITAMRNGSDTTAQPKPFDESQGITGQDIVQHPFVSLGKTLTQPPAQSLYGKTLQQQVVDASPKRTMTPQEIQQYQNDWHQAPDDEAKLGLADRFKATGAAILDQAGNPINAVGGLVAEPIAKGVGMAADAVGQTGTNIGRYFSRIGNTFKPDAVKNLNLSNSERIGNLATRAKGEAATDINPIQKTIADTKAQTDKTLGSIKESRIVLKKNLQQLNMNLQSAAEKGSVDFQKKLPDFFNANSEAYGNARDNAFAQMTKEGKGITNQEVFDSIQKTKQDISNALIPADAPALKVIRQLEAKYNPTVSEESSPILGENGQPIATTTTSKANDFVDLPQLVQDLRNVKSTLSSGAAAGRTGFSQEDLAVNYLNHNLGDYIKEKVPAFAQLQKDYSPVMGAMKEAHIIFKPNAGEFTPRTATGFLKKAGTGKLQEEGRNLLGALEQGNKFSPGVGNISSEVKNIGKSMDDIKIQMSKFDEQARSIQSSSKSDIAQQQASIANRKAILQKRLDGLEKRRQEVSIFEANKDVVGRLKKAIFHKAADAAGVGAVKAIL